MILKFSLDLPEDDEYLRTIRLLSKALLEDLRVIEEDKIGVETIVSELCTNVIRHAQSTEGKYHLALEYHQERVVITVEDKGAGFAPEEAPPPGTYRPDELAGGMRVGGYGMLLVQALSDRIQFELTEPRGTKVQAEKVLRYETRQAKDRATKMDKSECAALEATLD
jgi:serine/threonine-protein kinase RsbW